MEKEKQVVTQISEQKVQLQNGDKEVSNVVNQENKKIFIKRGEKMKNKKNNLYFAIAGILAPILWFILVVVLGALEPGYSHMSKMMSLLGGVEGIRGFIFNTGISTVGALIILFAIGLYREFGGKDKPKIGTTLLILGGIGLIFSGIFHCNLNCTNVILEKNFTGIMHMLFAFIAGMGLAISPFFIFGKLKKNSAWKKYAKYKLGAIAWLDFFGVAFLAVHGKKR